MGVRGVLSAVARGTVTALTATTSNAWIGFKRLFFEGALDRPVTKSDVYVMRKELGIKVLADVFFQNHPRKDHLLEDTGLYMGGEQKTDDQCASFHIARAALKFDMELLNKMATIDTKRRDDAKNLEGRSLSCLGDKEWCEKFMKTAGMNADSSKDFRRLMRLYDSMQPGTDFMFRVNERGELTIRVEIPAEMLSGDNAKKLTGQLSEFLKDIGVGSNPDAISRFIEGRLQNKMHAEGIKSERNEAKQMSSGYGTETSGNIVLSDADSGIGSDRDTDSSIDSISSTGSLKVESDVGNLGNFEPDDLDASAQSLTYGRHIGRRNSIDDPTDLAQMQESAVRGSRNPSEVELSDFGSRSPARGKPVGNLDKTISGLSSVKLKEIIQDSEIAYDTSSGTPSSSNNVISDNKRRENQVRRNSI